MPDPIALSSDAELRALVERALTAGYELDREIGRGGMGIVYRAKDRRLKRAVAIKLLPPELAFRGEIKTRFLREAETAAQLSHPNIVPIYSVDERDGLVYFVMACVDGTTLGKQLHEEKRLSIDDSRRILREVADALAYAHARGVIHRDIKPDNILLDAESGRAMVTDFGIARAVQDSGDSRLTATGVAIGTPAYMSPEQAAGDRVLDGRSDLYSLGIVAYQMLAGELPFQAGTTPTMLMKHITERPVPVHVRRADCPPDLAAIVMTLLEKEPDHRFASASMLSRALQGDPSAMPDPAAALASQGTSPRALSPLHAAPGGHSAHDRVSARARGDELGTAGGARADDIARWSAPQVQDFRRKFATYAAVNVVIVFASIFGDSDFLTLTVFWSMYMAFKYSKLWGAGYDWRDVFRQPRDRRLVDVASETVDDVRGIFSGTRQERRDRVRQYVDRIDRGISQPPDASPQAGWPPSASGGGRDAASAAMRQAEAERAEIRALVSAMPKAERKRWADLIPVADQLYARAQALARGLVESARVGVSGALEELDAKIVELEAEANPLDFEASERRVRRLADLKRQRRALIDTGKRRAEQEGKLESCVLELQNLRLNVVRLRASGAAASPERITMLTERARSLADEVDAAVYAADEVNKLVGVPPRQRRRRERGA